MIILSAAGIAVYFGDRELFSGVSFEVGDRDKIGLIGAGGAGKTTLFRVLTGSRAPDAGGFAFASGVTLGYMEQYLSDSGAASAYEETLSVGRELLGLERELEQINQRLESGADDGLILRQFELRDRFERGGGLTFKNRARAALLGLGFTENEMGLPVSALSGGQRSKISLAKLLLADAPLLLLDEPTNHLDIDAVRWLEDFLAGRAGAYIVISHDRYFLDRVTSRTFELEHGRLNAGNGGYTAYMQQKEADREARMKRYELQKREIKRMEEIIAQFRQFNREKSVKQAESREKQLEKLKKELIEPPKEGRGMRFSFPVTFPGPTEVLRAEGLSKRFDKVLYKDASFELFRGERAFLIGKNGCGKTTLLGSIVGRSPGVTLGPGVKVGYYEQGQEGQNPENTALDEVWNAHRRLSETTVRSALAAFLFRGDDVYKKIKTLSGGERARVAILRLMLSGCNLLLLDEPTNHLDLYARRALEDALSAYGGTLLAVSHDRYFINRLATKVMELTPGGIEVFDGDYDAWMARRESAPPAPRQKPPGRGGRDWAERRERAAALRRARGRLERLEEEIAETEAKLSENGALLAEDGVAGDYARVLALTEENRALQTRDAALLEEWERLSEELSRLSEEEEQINPV